MTYKLRYARFTGLRMLIALLALFCTGPVQAVTPDEMLNDKALEARAREISQHLRCVVCQNQSIDDSSAPLARDLRILVRDRLTLGDSDAQALDYIVARYGNFVLLRPPFQFDTLLLWLGPFAFILLAGLALVRVIRRQDALPAGEASPELSPEECRRLEALTNEGTSV